MKKPKLSTGWLPNKLGGQSLILRVDGSVIGFLDVTYGARRKSGERFEWEVEIADVYKTGREASLEAAKHSAELVATDAFKCAIEDLEKGP